MLDTLRCERRARRLPYLSVSSALTLEEELDSYGINHPSLLLDASAGVPSLLGNHPYQPFEKALARLRRLCRPTRY